MNTDLILSNEERMSSLEIAKITGKQHAHVMRDIKSLLEQGVNESNFGLMYRISKIGNGAERKDPYYELTKKGCLILASGYDAKLREKIIDRWEELEIGKSKPKVQLVKVQPVKAPSVRDKMAVASWMIKTLNLNNNSKLRLVKAIADPLGLPSPDYTESKDQLLSATELLKRCGSTLSAQAFNAKMLAKGLLTTLQRQSHRGMKKFKSLTAKGLEFGENQVSPNNPKETQPLYYVGRFPELLQLVGITKECTTDENK